MTVFTTSSPRQISFQIWFLHENPSDRPTLLTVARTDIHLYLCFWEILHEGVQETIEDNSVGAGGRTQRRELHSQRDRGDFFFLSFCRMISRLWKHILRRRREHPALVSCLFVGEIWAVSNEFLITEKGTHYHFCILSPFPFFIRLCKHKKVLKQFFFPLPDSPHL